MAERKEYSEKVSQLLKIGEPTGTNIPDWPDYPALFELGSQDIPDLIELATDRDTFDNIDKDESDEKGIDGQPLKVWGPVHAWRTLGQLHAESASEPLLTLFSWDDDWANEELPQVYGLIGPAAIPALQNFITENQGKTFPAASAVEGLQHIGKIHPAAAGEIGQALIGQLEKYADSDAGLNGYVAAALAELKVVEALPLLETAYEQDKVDFTVIDLDTIKHDLGLLSDEEYKRREVQNKARRQARLLQMGQEILPGLGHTDPKAAKQRKNQKAKAKVKRKMASASRKKNRKK